MLVNYEPFHRQLLKNQFNEASSERASIRTAPVQAPHYALGTRPITSERRSSRLMPAVGIRATYTHILRTLSIIACWVTNNIQ